MAQTRPCDVSPTGDQDKYSIALISRNGQWFGFDAPLYQTFPSTSDVPPPLERISINSLHGGRGADRFIPQQYAYYDAQNLWTTTPGKAHPTLLARWARGLIRYDEMNMPDANGVTWKPLVGKTRYLDASFTRTDGTFTAKELTMLIRKRVPAGSANVPGTLTVELCSDSAGLPDTVLQTMTITANDVDDVVSVRYSFSPSYIISTGTKYHIKIYGSASDQANLCWEVGCDPATGGLQKSTTGSWTATTFSPYYRLANVNPKVQYKPFIFDGAMYLVAVYDDGTSSSRLFLNGNRGRATGTQSSTTLRDTSYGAYGATAWPTNRFRNAYVRIIRGVGRGQVRKIISNDATTLVVSEWDVTPVSGSSEYVIYSCDWFVEIAGTGLSVVTGDPVVQNGIVYFPQGDATVIRRMRLNSADTDFHEFGSESTTNNNKAYFLEPSYDSAKGEPVVWRVNQSATSGSTPNGRAVSVAKASTAPAGVALAWGTDMTFGTSVLTGDNTSLITNIHDHEGSIYVFKEDGLYVVKNDRALKVRLGVETAPEITNGRAAVTAGDKNMYLAYRDDVYLITGGGAYSTNLKHNLPDNRAGVIYDLIAAEGWVFAAVNGGSDKTSSVMKFSLDTKTWSEQWRANAPGKRIRNLQWQPCPETRPRLWMEVDSEMMFQEFPIFGVRPYNDKELKYEHEGVLILPTIDLGTTDPKYFATMTVTSEGLAQDGDAETGSVIVVECQTDNDIGTDTWEHVDYIRSSPTASVVIGRGSSRTIRIRLRLISSEATDPVVLEISSLSLFTRRKLAHEWTIQFPVRGDDDEQNSVELLKWLVQAYKTAEPLTMKSRFTLFDGRTVTLADEPRYQLSELNETENELEAQVWMKLVEVI